MRINTQDLTLQRNYLEKYRFLIEEYEMVKKKIHPEYTYVKDFYQAHDTCSKSFLKYYNRYKQSGSARDLLPQKRGPRYRTRRPLPFIEHKVISLREKGNNRYEIYRILQPALGRFTPTPSGVYQICKRYGLNKLTLPMRTRKQRIIKHKAGELAHIDCHYLSKSIVRGESKKRYLVCVIDDCTRIAWAEIVADIQALTVMFATLKCFNIIGDEYTIRFEEVLTDNGSEFGTKISQSKTTHPFERLLQELQMKHRYTRPYRPQTNGKVERFWRTLEDDMLRDTFYDSEQDLKDELINYLYYYNTMRPHQGINNRTPVEMRKALPN
jgi:hypothetical protein